MVGHSPQFVWSRKAGRIPGVHTSTVRRAWFKQWQYDWGWWLISTWAFYSILMKTVVRCHGHVAHGTSRLYHSVSVSMWFTDLFTAILALQAMGWPMSDASGFRTTRAWKLKRWFSTAFRRYGVKTSQYTLLTTFIQLEVCNYFLYAKSEYFQLTYFSKTASFES